MVEGNGLMLQGTAKLESQHRDEKLQTSQFSLDSDEEEPANQTEINKSCDQVEEPITGEQHVQKAPDGGWGWLIVVGSCLIHTIIGGFERSNGVFYLQLRSKYNQSATATSWVLSIFSTLRLSMAPVASALCNKYSCRVVVLLGAAISSLGILISAFVPDLPYLYLTYGVLGGIGRAFTYTPSLIIVGYYFNKRRGIAVGLSTSGVGIGSFVFPPIIEIVFNYYGFMGTFLILSAISSHFLICGALFRPLHLHRKFMTYKRKHLVPKEDPEEKLLAPVSMATHNQNLLASQSAVKMSSSMEITANVEIESKKTPFLRRKLSKVKLALKGSNESTVKSRQKPLLDISLFKNFAFTALCIQLFLFTISFNATFVFLPALAKEKGITQLEGAYLISILGFFDAVSRIGMSTVLDLKRIKPYRLIIYNTVMFFVSIVSLLIPLMKDFWQFAILSGLYGVLSGTYISQKSVVVVDILGVENLTSSFGLLLMFQGLSALIGPTLGGLLKDFLGSYDITFYCGSVGIVAGGVTMAAANVWLYRQKKAKQQLQMSTP